MSRSAINTERGLNTALAEAEKEVLDVLSSVDLVDTKLALEAVRTYQVLRRVATRLRVGEVAAYHRGD